jgi:hypothetical protein
MKSNNIIDEFSSNKVWKQYYSDNLDSFGRILLEIKTTESLDEGISEDIQRIRSSIYKLRQIERSL